MTGRKTKRDSPQRLERRAEIREEKRLLKRAKEAEFRNELVRQCAERISFRPEDREAFEEMLGALVRNNVIPPTLLTSVPARPAAAGKTRFEQIYDACMFLAFADYRPVVRRRAFGPEAPDDMKLWRAMFPKEYGLSHVVIRARSFQEAFALSCDYACRLSLREKRRIPSDISIRVQFIQDRSVSRMLAIRESMKDNKRRTSGHKSKEFSAKDIMGARLVAIGRKGTKEYSIFKYAEYNDLSRILRVREEVRSSAVEMETFRPKGGPEPYDSP